MAPLVCEVMALSLHTLITIGGIHVIESAAPVSLNISWWKSPDIYIYAYHCHFLPYSDHDESNSQCVEWKARTIFCLPSSRTCIVHCVLWFTWSLFNPVLFRSRVGRAMLRLPLYRYVYMIILPPHGLIICGCHRLPHLSVWCLTGDHLVLCSRDSKRESKRRVINAATVFCWYDWSGQQACCFTESIHKCR